MINIVKAVDDPQPLQNFKDNTHTLEHVGMCNYDLFQNPQRTMYKRDLLREQYYLCAYCNRNLDEFLPDDKLHHLKIEHWYPQALCKAETDTYGTVSGTDVAHWNMLIVCPGQNVNPNFRHCDSSRTAGRKLNIKPQDPNYRFGNVFTYQAGSLVTASPEIRHDIETELNLNDGMLVYRRNIVLDQFRKQLPVKNMINKEILLKKYSEPNGDNHKKEYCTLILFFIENYLH